MRRRLLIALASLWMSALPLAAFPVVFGGMTADLPEGWTVVSSDQDGFAASSGAVVEGSGVFQAGWMPSGTYPDAMSMSESVRAALGARGEQSVFVLDGGEAVLSEVSFSSPRAAMRGYLLCRKTDAADVVLLAYANVDSYDTQVDFLLSALDSFRTVQGDVDRPGPISQFLWPYPAPATRVQRVPFDGATLSVGYATEELDALDALIEREARILVHYTDRADRDEAWRRYYRMIWRDSRPRLEPAARELGRLARGESGSAEEAQAILGWLQGFTYERTGSLSDLASPLQSVIGRTGDCDARALALVLILSHLGTDGVILVSSVYSHAVAAVAVDAPGLGLELDGRKYVLAETTKRVPLGWLAEDMRTLSNWVVVRFDGRPL